MREGFFPSSMLDDKQPALLLPQCGKCGLLKTCKTPKMRVDGEGRKRILIVGEAPGKNEDEQGRPFVGKAGQLLAERCQRFDVNLRRDCWLYNSLICRPPANRKPTAEEIGYCRPNILKVIKELQPDNILLLGGPAVQSVLGHVWKQDTGEEVTKWVGWQIPCYEPNSWICPNYHPSFVARSEDEPVVDVLFTQYLAAALGLQGKPWQTIPNYKSRVKRILCHEKAAKWVGMFTNSDRPVAFDHETNTLKPYTKGARIVSCSMSDGETTIAYPWHGKSIEATKLFLQSNTPKVASNQSFEECWGKVMLGTPTKNWWRDTMLRGHWMDNRSGITSIKFQAFVRLGAPDWTYNIKQYLENVKDSKFNRIHEIAIDDLLLYNGLDALYEIEVAHKQEF